MPHNQTQTNFLQQGEQQGVLSAQNLQKAMGRKSSVNSAGRNTNSMFQTMQTPNKSTSLLGTTARQKLLALKLAKAAKCDSDQKEIETLDLKINAKPEHASPVKKQLNSTKNAVDAKRAEKQKMLEAVYTAGVVVPTPIAKSRYFHRSLNPKKLIEVNNLF